MAALIGLDSTSSGFDPGLQDPPITFGVWGDSGDAAGVIGSSNTGVGVFGRSTDAGATAVRGSSQNGTGVDATSTTGSALHARRGPGGAAAVTEAFLATPSLAADFRGDVATTGALRVGGRLGIGIGAQTGPAAKLHVNGAEEGIRVQGPAIGNANSAYISFVDSAGTRIGYVGDGSIHEVNVTLASDRGDVVLETAAGRILTASSNGKVGIATSTPEERLHVEGNIRASGRVILNGADCAEDFDAKDAQALEPGTVMVIGDEDGLHQSEEPYDKRVAGVLSGAGDYQPGIILGEQQSQSNRLPLALTGKVFCKVDAQYSPIGVGDLLTTSPTLGHAMKVTDPLQAFGAVIGKALRPMAEGQGLIPILVALQ